LTASQLKILDSIEQMEMGLLKNSSLTSVEKNNFEKIIESKKKDIQLLESNAYLSGSLNSVL
jgi:hypothetical protein